MKHVFTFETLLQTPVCMMTGEQLAFLVSNLPLLNKQGNKASSDEETAKPRRLVYGIKGIADTFGCSIPTANRIKRSGVIDDTITQVGRKIVVDADLALELAAKAKMQGKEVASGVMCAATLTMTRQAGMPSGLSGKMSMPYLARRRCCRTTT